MSIINCYCDEYCYGEIFPNISLVILKNIKTGYKAENDVEPIENSIAFTISNDPFIIINKQPINNKYYYISDEETDNLNQEEFNELINLINEQNSWFDYIKGYAEDMWVLINAIKEAGYVEGNIGGWINQKVAEYLETARVLEIYKRI